jgi:acylphosphatase
MKRLTAYVSGKVQKAGYRARVVDIGRELGLKGFVQNLDDGRVKIIADGEDDVLGRFLKDIDIKNTIIRVDSISIDYSEATDIFDDFSKRVNKGETDSRLDEGIEVLKGILVAIKDMHADLGNKQDKMLEKQDLTLVAISDMDKNLGSKIDNLGSKIDDNRADIVGEVRELRKDIKDGELVQMKNDIAEIKIKLKLQP